ncbi:MAG: Mur ligase domain-containing protein, partial [Candidatus Acidiferrales bacterium]
MRWTVADVAGALGVAAPSGANSVARLAGVSIDSRTVERGELFVAICGPRHDGHTFVAAALAQGAAAAVVNHSCASEYPAEIQGRLLAVEDTLHALQELARSYCDAWRNAKPGRRVAAVTGSAGKTTTKEILAA